MDTNVQSAALVPQNQNPNSSPNSNSNSSPNQKSKSEVSAQVYHIEQGLKKLDQDILEKEQEMDRVVSLVVSLATTKTEIIYQYLEHYKRLAELGEYKKPVNHICTDITKRLKDLGCIKASGWVRRVIKDEKYKIMEKDTSGDERQESIPISVFDESQVNNEVLEKIQDLEQDTLLDQKPVNKLEPEELQASYIEDVERFNVCEKQIDSLSKLRREFDKRKKLKLSMLEERKIAVPHIPQSQEDQDYDDPYAARVSTESLAARNEDQLYESMNTYGSAWMALADTYADHNYMIKQMDRDAIAGGLNVVTELVLSLSDLKYSFNLKKWLVVGKDCIDYGKHAAAKRNRIEAPRCVKCECRLVLYERSDNDIEKTGYDLRCPKCGKSEQDRRGLTREQIEAIISRVFDFAGNSIERMNGYNTMFQKLIDWHTKAVSSEVADRKLRAHDKFSDRSIGHNNKRKLY